MIPRQFAATLVEKVEPSPRMALKDEADSRLSISMSWQNGVFGLDIPEEYGALAAKPLCCVVSRN